MTQLETLSSPANGSRLIRLPLVLLLGLGLLLSLIHCAGCELNFPSAAAPMVTVSDHQGSAPDAPEQAVACHSGHCLSHVAPQLPSAVALPADLLPRAHVLRQEPFPTALAGLPLFEPPRA
jgi:hypothetical protein